MPIIIQKYQADVRMSPDKSQALVSPDEARKVGEDIARFGQNAVSLIGAVGQQTEAMRKTERELEYASFQNKTTEASTIAEGEAYAKAGKKGEGLTDTYNETYKKAIQPHLDGIKDPDAKARATVEAEKIRVRNFGELYQKQIAMFKQGAEAEVNEIKNQNLNDINVNPYALDDRLQKSTEMFSKVGMTAANTELAIRNNRKEAVETAIHSATRNEDYDYARSLLVGKHSGAFDAAEVKRLSEEIEGQQLKRDKEKFQDGDAADKQLRKEKNQFQETNFRQTLDTVGKVDKADPQNVRDIEHKIDEDIALQRIKPNRGQMLKNLLREEATSDHPEETSRLIQMLVESENIEDFSEEVASSAALGGISAKTASEMLLQADQYQARYSQMNDITKRNKKQLESYALEKISAQFPKDQFGLPKSTSDATKLANMKRDFTYELQNPKHGGNPDMAADAVIGKYFKGYKASTKLKMSGLDNTRDMADFSTKLYETKKLSKDEYLGVLRDIKARVHTEEGLKQRKDGVKK